MATRTGPRRRNSRVRVRPDELKTLLRRVRRGAVSTDEAARQIDGVPLERLEFATLDHERALRSGFPEVVFGQGKTPSQLVAILGRLYQRRDDLPHAAEWLERASEAPAPSANDGRELLFDLGMILETMGETARALAVFMELQADAGEYRDVAARVERLARVQTGG